MSRAFTKEDDAGDELHERPVPAGPNYVTPRGLELLRAAAQDLIARRPKAQDKAPIDRDLRYLEARLSSAIVVAPTPSLEIRFGAKIVLEDEAGARLSYQIVGEDEAREDPAKFLSWTSPLAQALLGAKKGDAVSWEGPEKTASYKILFVDY
jgi:transcription elongation GreA/GreB family factor